MSTEYDECFACLVGVATGPESHNPACPVRNIPMPEQDGQFGSEWTDYDRACDEFRAALSEEDR